MKKKDPLQKLESFIVTFPELKGAKIALLKQGYNRSIFLLKTMSGDLVARVERSTNDGGSSIDKELILLSFLEQKGVPFVPKVTHYSKAANILIETFVAKKVLDLENITQEQLSLFASQLVTIHQLPVSEFLTFCKQNKFSLPKPTTELANIKMYGTTRFKKASKTCPDKEVIAWIKTRLEKNIASVRSRKRRDYHIIWGDIGTNLLVNKNRLFFIDFEFSGIGIGSELSYIKIHSHLKPSSFKLLVKQYSHFSGVPTKTLYEEIKHEEKITRLNDVIWAAMKWGENRDTPEEEKYQDLTFKRIKLFEKLSKTD